MVNRSPNAVCSSPTEEWNRVFAHRIVRNGDCLEFVGARTKANYGKMGYQKQWCTAHRVSFMLLKTDGRNFEQLKDVVIRHTCDNPPCINPAHLLAGTHADNFNDMVERKRGAWQAHPELMFRGGKPPHVPGEKNGQAKLKEQDVLAMRIRRANGASQGRLAKEFGVTRTMVRYIVTGRNWKHGPWP